MSELDRIELTDFEKCIQIGSLFKLNYKLFQWCISTRIYELKGLVFRSSEFDLSSKYSKFYMTLRKIMDSPELEISLVRIPLEKNQAENLVHEQIGVSIYSENKRSNIPNESSFKWMTPNDSNISITTSIRHNQIISNDRLELKEDISCALEFSDKLINIPIIQLNQEDDKLKDDLQALLDSGLHSDVSFYVSNKELKAHRSILSARSPVFKAMFDHDTFEKQENRINIEDASSETIYQMLQYLYTGKVPEMTAQDYVSLSIIADKYDIQQLKGICSKQLSLKISSDNALDILTMDHILDKNLKQVCIEEVIAYAEEIIQSEKWMIFMVENTAVARDVTLSLVKKLKSRTRMRL